MKEFKVGDVVKLTKKARKHLDCTCKDNTAVVIEILSRPLITPAIRFDGDLLTGYVDNHSIDSSWLKLAKKKYTAKVGTTIWYITPEGTIDFVIASGQKAQDKFLANTPHASTDINQVATQLRSHAYWL